MASRTAMAVLAAGVAAQAYEYDCFDRRSGALVAHPISKDEARKLENSDGRVECFRKGVPITSKRDEYIGRREQERARRLEEGYGGQWGGGQWGGRPAAPWRDPDAARWGGGSLRRAARACREAFGYGSVELETERRGDTARVVVQRPDGYVGRCVATLDGEILRLR